LYSVIGSDGSKYGPIDSQTLQTWASQRRINPSSVIEIHDTGQQVPASQLSFLQPIFFVPPQIQNAVYQQPGVIQVPAGTHSVGTAVLLALLITGLGQIYNKQGMKGLVILLISVVLAVFTCGLSILLTHPFAVIDAVMIAGRLNRGEAISEWQCF
jgi:TM2 domain-containing membrane protein YozV